MPSLRDTLTVGWAQLPTPEGYSKARDSILQEYCDADRYTRERAPRCPRCHAPGEGECANCREARGR